MAFKTICVDHVGIACAGTLEEAAKIYTEVLGLKATGTEEVKEQGVATVFVPCGETLIELLIQIDKNAVLVHMKAHVMGFKKLPAGIGQDVLAQMLLHAVQAHRPI